MVCVGFYVRGLARLNVLISKNSLVFRGRQVTVGGP